MQFNKGDFRYNMTKNMANEYIKSLNNKKINKQKTLCDWVNKEFGIKGNCIEVTLD